MTPSDTPPESRDTWSPDAEPAAPRGPSTWVPDASSAATPLSSTTTDGSERYADAGLLGRGGLAEVRSVHDARLGREVAIKRLRRLDSRIGRTRFLREARITAQLEHPSIVPIYDADTDEDGVPFYTMKYVRGTALSAALRSARDPAARLRLLPAFGAVCQAMAYAHDRRVIHRDLKPDNIMLGEFGEAMVVDWGLARALDEDDEVTAESPSTSPTESGARPIHIDGTSLTVQGQVAGTPVYMAPEQARGERTTPATDVFALGAILYEILTGQPPHGVAPDLQEQLRRAHQDPVVSVLVRSPDAPADLAAIAERALAPHPNERYGSAGEMATDVQRWSTGRLVQAHTYTPREHLRRFVGRYRLPLMAGGVGVVGVVVVGIIGIVNTGAQRDLAQANERKALRAAERAELELSRMLTERAERAVNDSDHAAARAFASASLALQESPRARGTLAKSWGVPGPTPSTSAPLPHRCLALALLPGTDGGEILCGGPSHVSRLTIDGDVLWTTELDAEASQLVLSPPYLWVGSDRGVFLLDPGTGTVREQEGTGRVRAMRDLEPGIRWFEDGSKALASWRPGEPVRTQPVDGSRIVDLEMKNGVEVRLHAAGYTTAGDSFDELQSMNHVAYDMVPLSDGWFVGGSSSSWLHDDGRITRHAGLTGSIGLLRSNRHDQVVGVSSDHTVWVYDTAAQIPVARIPSRETARPAVALDDDVMVTAHDLHLRSWTLPPPLLRPSPTFAWQQMAERRDGGARLFCGNEGKAELHDLVAHRVVPLAQPPDIDARLVRCTFVGEHPTATWTKATVQWSPDGTRLSLASLPRGAVGAHAVGSVLVDEYSDRITTRNGRHLGDGLVPSRGPDEFVVQDLDQNVVRWFGPGRDPNRLDVLHELPVPGQRRALATLPGLRVAHAPEIQDGDLVVAGTTGSAVQLPHPTRVTAAAPLGERWLVTGDQRGTLYLWDLATQRILAQSNAHGARVHQIHVTGRGAAQRIVSVSFDRSMHSWAVPALFLPATDAVSAVQERDGIMIDEGELRLASDDIGAP